MNAPIRPPTPIHPGIVFLQRAEAKIYLVRSGEETVESAIMDLAPAFFELVHPMCGCSREIYDRMERNYPHVPPKQRRPAA